MKTDIVKEFSRRYCIRFGQIAVELGFLSKKQLQEALAEQVEDDIAHRPHRLVGEICLQKGWLTPRQVEIILDKHLDSKKKFKESTT
jgi:hypothetical protein